jgi:hypothetical protein
MPKQVRLRRGTTAQHTTFTGADGEVTFDTTKKVLVLHDGVTAGGRPLEGWVALDPGDPLALQEIKSSVRVSGGDSESWGLSVDNLCLLNLVIIQDVASLRAVLRSTQTLVYAATVQLNFAAFSSYSLDLAGNVSFTTLNLVNGLELVLRIKCDGTLRTLSFPAGWKFVGATAPANIAANKLALLQLRCYGGADSDVVARYLVEL